MVALPAALGCGLSKALASATSNAAADESPRVSLRGVKSVGGGCCRIGVRGPCGSASKPWRGAGVGVFSA
eukprot:3643243-Lingulodinium_polyedra.AAC.1